MLDITKLKLLRTRLMRPAGDDESGSGGGGLDRGDDFTPTDDEDEDDEARAEAEAAAAAKEAAAKEAAKGAKDDESEEGEGEEGEGEEEKEEGKDEPKADKAKREPRIPLSRHKEMLEKARAERDEMAQKLAQFQQGREVAQINQDITAAENVVLALEKEYATLLADGEVDKATAVMAKIRATERDMAEAKSDMKIAAAEARATERARYNVALDRIEAAFPQLNQDSESYDAALMAEVVDLKAAYEGRGLTPTQAMQKAVKLLVGAETSRQETAVESTPRVTKEATKAAKDPKDVAAERKEAAVKKTLEATGKQPPSLTKVGMDSDKAGGGLSAKDVMKMSQDDFRKLPEEVLAKMRGDDF